MPLSLMQDSQKVATFRAAHQPLAYEKLPVNPPQGAFEAGPGFFEQVSLADLQSIVDTTWKNRTKLMFNGRNAADAKKVLEAAATGSGKTVRVRWGLHQSRERPLDRAGKSRHFTVAGDPRDWHLYVNTDASRVGFMSNSADPADMVEIAKP